MFGSFTNALVNSGHDHWYYLLYNIKQRVQNCLFSVVTSSSQYLGLLKSLQWLPIKSRIIFKLNLWYIGLNIVYWQALVSRCFITFQELSANTEIRNYEAATSRTTVKEKIHSSFLFAAQGRRVPENTTHWTSVGWMWPIVCDAGPTFNQHCFNVSCLLGACLDWFAVLVTSTPSGEPTVDCARWRRAGKRKQSRNLFCCYH